MSAVNTPNAQGVYSPLPYSDSESEEEVFSKSSQLTSRKHESQHKISPNHILTGALQNGKAISNAESTLMAEYRPLSNSETSLNGFPDKSRVILVTTSPKENIKFEHHNPNSKANNQTGWEGMSHARKLCFLSSIFLCVFTIVGFLWILPCDLESNCEPTSREFSGDHSQLTTPGSWESVFQGIELTGPPIFTQNRLIFAVRGPQPAVRSLTSGEPKWRELGYGPYSPDKRSGGQAGGGALALLPTTGSLLWTINIPGAAPTAANCELLDVNSNRNRDCLFANADSILAAIDPKNGKYLWTLDAQRDNSTIKNNSGRQLKLLQPTPAKIIFPPIVVQDLDDDNVSELLALGSHNPGRSTDCFVLISGKTGTIIGQLVNVSGCTSISKLELSEEGETESVLFDCLYAVGGVSVRKMNVEEIYLRAINKSQQDLASAPPIQKRQQPYRDSVDHSSYDGHSYLLEAEGHYLSIENSGTCPKCKSVLTLTDDRNTTVWGYTGKGERAMSPVSLHFSGTTTYTSGSPIHKNGFVFKLWVWPPSAPKSSKSPRKPKSNEPIHKLMKRSEKSYIIDHGGAEEGSPNLNNDVEVLELKERVVLITFSSTDLHVVNASQSNIAVLCATNKQRYRSSFDKICQPELAAQQKSLLVADLDADGTQELVSFTSTYNPVAEPEGGIYHPNRFSTPILPSKTSWELISKIKVIHLETELSKLK